MKFLSDNAARVHPRVWEAMRAADTPDSPYDGDALSNLLDERFSALFGRDCAALWVATGTAANCLALSAMVEPHGAVICHREAHIEMDEGGAPGFYLHGAKLLLAGGEGAKITPEAVARIVDSIRDGVHQVQPHAISITQASEYGCVYRPEELAGLANFARGRGLGLHMDGARFANAAAFLGGDPALAAGLGGNAAGAAGGVDALSFGMVKNGGMSAEAIVFFDPAMADKVRFRRKRAGHLQSKGRYLAAQILAMLEGDLWLDNARAANAAAGEIAAAAGDRLLHPVEANEIFLTTTAVERLALRELGFEFYDWGEEAARLVTAWDSREDQVSALAKAIAAL
ncbi:threonine aldolase family protein [Novosphingobium lindaniclasticum]|nr:beta-eliminating lyase-related protein [Novosphingobium lindaniclasticum]